MKKTILIDDLRWFIDRRPATVLKNSRDGLEYLKTHHGEHFDELWLDHDLGILDGEKDTIMKIVDYLSEAGFNDNHFNVDVIFVHTSNRVGADQMVAGLNRYGYNVRRVQAERFFLV